jgi:hypothetical protein
MIHYHGTPFTPNAMRDRMQGKFLCVSFARPDNAKWAMDHAQGILWDNGAYSLYTRGEKVDWAKYYKWLEPLLGHPHWAIVPDSIDGTVEEQRELVAAWPFRRELSAPVWHMAEPIDYLLELSDDWPRLCFGSSGAYWQVGSEAWCRRADEAFNALARRGPLPWVHLLRGLNMAGDYWPFASADSAHIARKYHEYRMCPERMARIVDGRQSPIHWKMKAEQEQLI